ncbi:hypothetical protein AWB82_02893 [Caballeronia glebae]|uniref:Uncharacterized protein n=1 Tax=Caballeronia glebae TaxID=1777143 RepID=A0A158ARZ7_9BURK|nr:hypothetical protein [Caballeronia glebae]SAK60728.1 hypothetical protein AWB82_02893 [Caballeronia glebae]
MGKGRIALPLFTPVVVFFVLRGGATFVALFANAVVFVAISGAQCMLRSRIDTAVESASES